MENQKRWIWEQEDYPNFTFNSTTINPLIQEVTFKQGYLTALTTTLNEESLLQRQCATLIDEAINTAAIEGEDLNRDSVRASIGKKLGLFNLNDVKGDPETEGLIDILMDANTNYNKDLDIERIFGWHNALFPRGYSGMNKINVAQYRDYGPMEVVSGYAGREVTHFVAPDRELLEDEMKNFFVWFNSKEDTLIKSAIAHLWFVIIHPLDDGNGRITRAVTDLVLSKIEKSKISRLYSMSAAINKDRKDYYQVLDETTGFIHKNDSHMDITLWVEWFLKTLSSALDDAKESLKFILEKTAFWDKHRNSSLNARQTKVLNKILDIGVANFEGGLNNSKYVSIAGTSSATASRDLEDLVNKGCIKQKKGTQGRSTSYLVLV